MPVPTAPRVVQLEGRILTSSGDAVNGAHVHVISGSRAVAETATDSAGHFAFDHLANGRVRVEAEHDPEGAVRSAEVSVSNVAIDLTLVLAPAGISGQVLDGDDGHAIAGASLSIEGAPFEVAGVTADSAGTFRFGAVPFDATAVVAVASGYRASHVVLEPREEGPEPSLHIVLHAAPPIEGDVVDADGDKIHAQIVACEGTSLETRVESGDDGGFRLPPSTLGCDAFATHDAMAPSETVSILEGRRLSLRLGAPGAIAGFVVDDRGAAVDAFSVGVESFVPLHGQNAAPRSAQEFGRGAFRLEHLVPGTYVLTATTADRPPARSSPIVVRSGATTDGVTIAIPPGGVVEGRVVDADNQPLADVELRFDFVSDVAESDAFAKTDSFGHYRLEGAPAGLFTVSAHEDGYKTKLVPGLRVASGATMTKDIMLTKGGGFELSGIGANLRSVGNAITIGGILPGNPADLIGLKAGDRIVRIDGEEIEGLSLADAIQELRGDPGTVVGITVLRGGETIDVAITRGAIVQ